MGVVIPGNGRGWAWLRILAFLNIICLSVLSFYSSFLLALCYLGGQGGQGGGDPEPPWAWQWQWAWLLLLPLFLLLVGGQLQVDFQLLLKKKQDVLGESSSLSVRAWLQRRINYTTFFLIFSILLFSATLFLPPAMPITTTLTTPPSKTVRNIFFLVLSASAILLRYFLLFLLVKMKKGAGLEGNGEVGVVV